MDDCDHICPLCCEELDISDREFYPCKCGYQVCMWCWHRIRESEMGLCPACRTPYGEDPHQFSAVDVEEVLKANKEKEDKAKRDKRHLDEESEIEIPKDRTTLANMRVIRRNLIYAVGLPPPIATEEILRRAEYFGQYGRIAKIVLNRSQVNLPDPRRASASAYVTFVHKEDTLACILAVDGFAMEHRTIRASYGTSKYCSAFIKNVRCNNPDCTYLHEMGAPEDTFTKQEIQAGYVTSGRDVLARQQQIVAEQMRLNATGIVLPRSRVGCGGPSGTGKACISPVFPPPEFEESAKSAPPLIPPPAGVARSVTTASPLLPQSANTTSIPLMPLVSKASRSVSVGATLASGVRSPSLTATVSGGGTTPPFVQRKSSALSGTTAASVVAGGRLTKQEVQDTRSMLTPLTPLKRVAKPIKLAASSSSVGSNDSNGFEPLRNSKKKGSSRTLNSVAVASIGSVQHKTATFALDAIGGDVIGPSLPSRAAAIGRNDTIAPSLDQLGGDPFDFSEIGHSTSSGALGGEVYNGSLPSKSAIGTGGRDRWNSIGNTTSTMSSNLWGGERSGAMTGSGGVIGSRIGQNNNSDDSSSALASLLGISLPTGSGSLHQSTSFWPEPSRSGPSALSSLNGTPINSHGDIGGSFVASSSLVGGIPIGGGRRSSDNLGTNSSKSDIALLQNLLPGVHITSDSEAIGSQQNHGWAAPGIPSSSGYTSGTLGNPSLNWNNGNLVMNSGTAMGAVGQSNAPQSPRRQGPIW